MSKVSYMILSESIVVNLSKGPLTIPSDDPRYNKVLELIRSGNLELEEMEKVVDNSLSWEGTGLELRDNLLYVEKTDMALPLELSSRIIDYRKKNIPMTSLINFWNKLKKNPSFNSRKMLFKFLEVNQHPFTEDGNFLAYRSVTQDFKDYHTKSFDNKPGSTCEVDRTEVDDNPNNTCSHGLHVAAWKYAIGFGGSDRRMVEVFVSPEDVVCVPTDYNNTKMRVSKFVVVKEVEAPVINQTVYGSDDPEMDDEDVDNDEDMHDSDCDCDSCYLDDEDEFAPYSEETVNQVKALARKFEEKYTSNEMLAVRISEEMSLDSADIEDILNRFND